jgi:hypothetical protein
MKFFVLTSILFFALISCNQNSPKNDTADEKLLQNVMERLKGENVQAAVVTEFIDAGTYTYVKLNDEGREFWAAITARPVEIGKSYIYADANLMLDFESKALGRTFDSVYFIQQFAELSAIEEKMAGDPHAHHHHTTGDDVQKKVNKVKPVKDGLAIADIYEAEKSSTGDRVTVSGEVVKINKNIMNRHWIHIQDGSAAGENGNLTITTPNNLDFGIGDVITFTGVLTYDKDFGSGYYYRAIVEDAQWEKFVAL